MYVCMHVWYGMVMVSIYECMYVYMYACTVCMYVCMYVCVAPPGSSGAHRSPLHATPSPPAGGGGQPASQHVHIQRQERRRPVHREAQGHFDYVPKSIVVCIYVCMYIFPINFV